MNFLLQNSCLEQVLTRTEFFYLFSIRWASFDSNPSQVDGISLRFVCLLVERYVFIVTHAELPDRFLSTFLLRIKTKAIRVWKRGKTKKAWNEEFRKYIIHRMHITLYLLRWEWKGTQRVGDNGNEGRYTHFVQRTERSGSLWKRERVTLLFKENCQVFFLTCMESSSRVDKDEDPLSQLSPTLTQRKMKLTLEFTTRHLVNIPLPIFYLWVLL